MSDSGHQGGCVSVGFVEISLACVALFKQCQENIKGYDESEWGVSSWPKPLPDRRMILGGEA
jgi:hypothetical protein